MAIIQSCCCCGWTLRTGCYASATFSLIYFFVFTWITGFLTVGRIQSYIYSPETYDGMHHHPDGVYNRNFYPEQHLHRYPPPSIQPQLPSSLSTSKVEEAVTDRALSVTLPSKSPTSPTLDPGNKENGQENSTKRISSNLPPSLHVLKESHSRRRTESISMLKVFLVSDFYSILQTVNLVMDLLCEIAGVYSSILLIRGLQQDKKSWFWPWMIVVPLHIGIDAFTIGGIMMEYFANPMSTRLSLVLITIFVDVTLNSINVYGLLCVVSQYQEYKAGRGTAAYLEFSSQTPTIMLETTNSTKTVLTKPNSLPPTTQQGNNNRRRSTKEFSTSRTLVSEKSESCCEEFSLNNIPDTKIEENKNNNGSRLKNGLHKKENEEPETPNSCVYSNEITWIETPLPLKDGGVVESTGKPRKSSLTTKFGKFLDVGKRDGGKNGSTEGDYANVIFRPQPNEAGGGGCGGAKVALLNNKVTLQPPRPRFLRNEESEIGTKSDEEDGDNEDFDDPTDDALSAFGIISRDKN